MARATKRRCGFAGVCVSQTKREKLKLLNRPAACAVRSKRSSGVGRGEGCASILHLIVAPRGAVNSLITEVIEDYIRLHVVDRASDAERTRGAAELIEAVQAYLK
jgi:DNA-binding FrmR family transcriptional regulator